MAGDGACAAGRQAAGSQAAETQVGVRYLNLISRVFWCVEPVPRVVAATSKIIVHA